MTNTIAFYEHVQSNGDRKEFQGNIKKLKIPLYNDWDSLSANIPNILFYHGNNVADLKTAGMYQTFKNELSSVWLIEFGGYDTQQKNEGEKIISYIKYSDLQNRLSETIQEISKLTAITKERLEEIIFAFDPKLEKLLEQFESASPYETTNKQGKVLKDAKTELQNYVGEYLEKQSKA